MRCEVFGLLIDLPPNGYAGWADGGRVEVLSSDASGHRTDYAVTPAYPLTGVGWCAHPQATGNGIGICRHLPDGTHGVLLTRAPSAASGWTPDGGGAGCTRNEIGPAELRRARGYLRGAGRGRGELPALGPAPQVTDYACARALVIPGETVTVRGEAEHELTIPADAGPASASGGSSRTGGSTSRCAVDSREAVAGRRYAGGGADEQSRSGGRLHDHTRGGDAEGDAAAGGRRACVSTWARRSKRPRSC